MNRKVVATERLTPTDLESPMPIGSWIISTHKADGVTVSEQKGGHIEDVAKFTSRRDAQRACAAVNSSADILATIRELQERQYCYRHALKVIIDCLTKDCQHLEGDMQYQCVIVARETLADSEGNNR